MLESIKKIQSTSTDPLMFEGADEVQMGDIADWVLFEPKC